MTTQHAKYIANSEVTYLHKDVQSGKYVVATNIRDLTQAFISRDVVVNLKRRIRDKENVESCTNRLIRIGENCKHDVIAEEINGTLTMHYCVVCHKKIEV